MCGLIALLTLIDWLNPGAAGPCCGDCDTCGRRPWCGEEGSAGDNPTSGALD